MTIGIVISGGDSVGINNFIHHLAKQLSGEILLFSGGIKTLMSGTPVAIDKRQLLDYSLSAMPVISSGRTHQRPKNLDYKRTVENFKKHNIDTLILCGGDGSLQFLKKLSTYGVNSFGVGMTIDNDVAGSHYTIGFSTACEQVKTEVSKIRQTGRALPDRVFMLEVQGANSGELALNSAIYSNADFALIPERPFNYIELANNINARLKDQNSVVLICSEAYIENHQPENESAINIIERELAPLLGCRIRKTIMGHGLRSGTPSCEEIHHGIMMANEIAKCINLGLKNKAIVVGADSKAVSIELSDINTRGTNRDSPTYQLAIDLKILPKTINIKGNHYD